MDQNDKDRIAKVICYGVGALMAYYVLMWLLPYVVGFFALLGAGYLFHDYQRRNRRKW